MEHEHDIIKFKEDKIGLPKEDSGCFVSRIDWFAKGRWCGKNVVLRDHDKIIFPI